MADLISSISYEPDATGDALAVGLDLHLAGATKLVVSWGDGTPLEAITPSSGTSLEHIAHTYSDTTDGQIVVRASAPGKTDERTTLALQAYANPYDRISSDSNDSDATNPLI